MPGGGLASYNLAGVAAEQPTGGGFAYAGCAAAEQPTPGGLLAGDTSDLDAEEAQLRREIAAVARQREEARFWKPRQQQQTVAALRAQYEVMARGDDVVQNTPVMATFGAAVTWV